MAEPLPPEGPVRPPITFEIDFDTEGFTPALYEMFDREPVEVFTKNRKSLTTYRFFGVKDVELVIDEKTKTVTYQGKSDFEFHEVNAGSVVIACAHAVVQRELARRLGPSFTLTNIRNGVDWKSRRYLNEPTERLKEMFAVTEVLDRETSAVYAQLYGEGAPGTRKFVFIWQNLDAVKEIIAKAPNLVPYFSSAWIYDNYTSKSYRNIEHGLEPVENLFAVVRKSFMEYYKLSKTDWTTYLKLKPKQAAWLCEHGGEIGYSTLLQVYRQTGDWPKVTAIKAVNKLLEDWHVQRAVKRRERVSLLDTVIVTALSSLSHNGNVRNWVATEFQQVHDWFVNQGQHIIPDKNQLKVNWRWFVRRSEKWHDEMATQKITKDGTKNFTWPSFLETHEEEGYRLVPLTSYHDLIIEGQSMHHCVGSESYARNCVQGTDIIFSIRSLDDNRLATCQLKKREGMRDWEMVQIRGKRNADPEGTTRQVGLDLARRYTQAEQALIRANDKAAREAEKARIKAEKAEAKAAKRAAHRAALGLPPETANTTENQVNLEAQPA